MKLEAARDAVGKRVRYSPAGGQIEHGTVRATSGQFVMVSYEPSGVTKATKPEDIELVDIHLPLGPPERYHREDTAHAAPCHATECRRQHLWEARCQCGDSAIERRRLHAVNALLKHSQRAAREAQR